MEAKATARYVRVSPRKARIVIDLIRGKSVPAAREILLFSDRAIAEVVAGRSTPLWPTPRTSITCVPRRSSKTAFADEGPTRPAHSSAR